MHQGTGQREPAAAAAAARVAGAEARPQSPVHDHDTEHLRQIGRNAEEAVSASFLMGWRPPPPRPARVSKERK